MLSHEAVSCREGVSAAFIIVQQSPLLSLWGALLLDPGGWLVF